MASKKCPFYNPVNIGNDLCKDSCALHTPYGCSFTVLAIDVIRKNQQNQKSNSKEQ